MVIDSDKKADALFLFQKRASAYVQLSLQLCHLAFVFQLYINDLKHPFCLIQLPSSYNNSAKVLLYISMHRYHRDSLLFLFFTSCYYFSFGASSISYLCMGCFYFPLKNSRMISYFYNSIVNVSKKVNPNPI